MVNTTHPQGQVIGWQAESIIAYSVSIRPWRSGRAAKSWPVSVDEQLRSDILNGGLVHQALLDAAPAHDADRAVTLFHHHLDRTEAILVNSDFTDAGAGRRTVDIS